MDRDEPAASQRASLYELIDLFLRYVEPVPTSWTFEAHQTLLLCSFGSASLSRSAAASEASHSCYTLPYCTAQSPDDLRRNSTVAHTNSGRAARSISR